MEIKAVIFDMDGVLVDSEPVYLEWEKRFFRQYGIEISDEMYRSTLGQSDADVEKFLEKIWIEHGREEEFKTLYELYYENPGFQEFNYRDVLNEGAEELLSFYRQEGKKVALASSSAMPDIKKMLSDCGLEKYFHAVVSGERFTKSKPDPEIYLYTAGLLGVSPLECAVIEDSEAGIAAAKDAGMYTIAKEEKRFRVNQSRADKRVEDLRELIKLHFK